MAVLYEAVGLESTGMGQLGHRAERRRNGVEQKQTECGSIASRRVEGESWLGVGVLGESCSTGAVSERALWVWEGKCSSRGRVGNRQGRQLRRSVRGEGGERRGDCEGRTTDLEAILPPTKRIRAEKQREAEQSGEASWRRPCVDSRRAKPTKRARVRFERKCATTKSEREFEK